MGMYTTSIVTSDQIRYNPTGLRNSNYLESYGINKLMQKADQDAMTHQENSSYLEHHGIKGQKWGIRRFQNKDGSLTKDGKARYGNGKTKYRIKSQSPFEKKRAKLEEKERRMTEKEEIQRRKNQLKERRNNLKNQGKSQDVIRNEKKVDTTKPKSAKDMSDQELRDFLSRYDMEKRYNQIINGPEKKKGSQIVGDILLKSGTAVATKYTTKAMEAMVEEMIKKANRRPSSSRSGTP